MSWEVLGSHFVYVEEVAPQSILLDETMKKWIFQLTKEQREEIVDTVFSMLDDAKIYTVDDFYNSKWKKVQELMKAKSKLSPETQELFFKGASHVMENRKSDGEKVCKAGGFGESGRSQFSIFHR
mgnify:CR=1 FL=1